MGLTSTVSLPVSAQAISLLSACYDLAVEMGIPLASLHVAGGTVTLELVGALPAAGECDNV